MDRLTSLTAFVRVVDSGGFSAAGHRVPLVAGESANAAAVSGLEGFLRTISAKTA